MLGQNSAPKMTQTWPGMTPLKCCWQGSLPGNISSGSERAGWEPSGPKAMEAFPCLIPVPSMTLKNTGSIEFTVWLPNWLISWLIVCTYVYFVAPKIGKYIHERTV